MGREGCEGELQDDLRFATCANEACKRDYKTESDKHRKRKQRGTENNYMPIAVLPPIRQKSIHDYWPFGLTGKYSKEIIDNYMSAPALNRQGRYEEEETLAAFWVKEMATITLPPDSPNVQTLLSDWNKADSFMLEARIFEKQHGIPAAASYILPDTERQPGPPKAQEGDEAATIEAPRVRWDWEAEIWRCAARKCRGWDRDKENLLRHTTFHNDQDFQAPQDTDRYRGVTLYERFNEMERRREEIELEAAKLPRAHNMYFWCRVRQARIVREYDLEQAMGEPIADVTELKNAHKDCAGPWCGAMCSCWCHLGD